MPYLLEVEINAEGSKLAYLGKGTASGYTDGGCYRIAGPKAWGGSRNIARLEISDSDLVEFIKSYASEIVDQLKALNDCREGQAEGEARSEPESQLQAVPSTAGLGAGGDE